MLGWVFWRNFFARFIIRSFDRRRAAFRGCSAIRKVPGGGGAWEGRRQGMQGPSVVGQTDAGLHAAPAPPAEGVAGLARHGGPSDFARRALRGSHYKDHTRAIASNNSCPVWPRPPLPTRGCLLKAPELLHPTQIPTRADAAPKLVIDHEHRNHRTSLAAPCAARIVKTRRGPPFQQQPPQ